MSDTTTREHAERLARLEQIASDTRDALGGIRSELNSFRLELNSFRSELSSLRSDLNSFRSEVTAEFRSIRTDMTSFRMEMAAELRAIRGEAKTDYRWLIGIMLAGFAGLLGVVGHGFHWL